MHLVLLGDSTIDNQSYTGDEPDVEAHIRAQLKEGSTVDRLARDGDVTGGVTKQLEQLEHLPYTPTHLVLSVGGNDALDHIDVFHRPATNVGGALSDLADILDQFQDNYRSCLDGVLAHDLPTVVCTIYNGDFPDMDYQRVVSTTVRLFDDVIMQCAFDAGCPVVDLRRVCTDSADYFNPIEPGAEGGRKIASAILAALEPEASSRSFVYPSGAQIW